MTEYEKKFCFIPFEGKNLMFRELLSKGYTFEDISYVFDLPVEQLINIMIRFTPQDDALFYDAIKNHYSKFHIEDNKFVTISDIHIGSFEQNYDLIFNTLKFCRENKIFNVVIPGDALECTCHKESMQDEMPTQIYKFKAIVEAAPDINFFYLYGNHEYNHFTCDISFFKDCKNVTFIGIGESYISLNDNKFIKIWHDLSYDFAYHLNLPTDLTLEGHHHGFNHTDDNSNISLSPLSYKGTPGFLVTKVDEEKYTSDLYRFNNGTPYTNESYITLKKIRTQ